MITVVRGRTGAALGDALADLLARPSADVLQPARVVIHSHGIERWISQHLATRLGAGPAGDGISANIRFSLPGEVIRVVLGALGLAAGAERWRPDPVAWALLDLVDAGLPQGLEGLGARVEAAGPRRLLVLTAIARHLTRYGLDRPDMLLAWHRGADVDGAGDPLPAEDLWQPRTFRLLADHLGVPSPAQAAVAAVEALDAGAPVAGLEGPLALFGFTAIPPAHLAVLSAVARRSDLTLLLLHPSPAAWAAAAGWRGTVDGDGLPRMPLRGQGSSAGRGSSAQQARMPAGRLLDAWGRDVRELQAVVQTLLPAGHPTTDLDGDVALPAGTVLGRIQRAVITGDDDRGGAGIGPGTDPADASVSLHACAGPARQVQVLRDQILHAMQEDETLAPRDIIVMCPDIEVFAPLVTAHLVGEGPDGADLRVRLADRSLRQTNPMLRLLEVLIDLAATRVTASRLLDLLGMDPVRRRFGWSDADLDTITTWVGAAAIRWGVDASDRSRFRLDGLAANTVDEGLDRLLLGVAMADEGSRSIGGITPHDDMEGGSVALAGRVAEAANRLGRIVADLQVRRSIPEWVEVLGAAVDAMGRPPWEDANQRAEVTAVLRTLSSDAEGTSAAVSLVDVGDVLADRLQGAPSRANHRTGDLTVCTLVPMRTVPHRMVCLLGMDDGAFPRRARPHVDDLRARAPRVGDHDPRTEDRQLLLDAVMATGERLVVLWTGEDPRTGAPVPPSVPVSELCRALDELDPASDVPLSSRLTTTHPRHAHAPEAFAGPSPSFDALAHRAALASRARAAAAWAPPISLAGRLRATGPLLDRPDLQAMPLSDLVAFMVDPARHFVRTVLEVYVPESPELEEEGVPVEVSGLDAWALGQALLASGGAADEDVRRRVLDAQRGRGVLPPPPLGVDKVEEVCLVVERITALASDAGVTADGSGTSADVDVVIGGCRLTGGVHGIVGDTIGDTSYSQIKPKRLMTAWIRLLAVTATDPSRPFSACIIGRSKDRAVRTVLRPLGEGAADREAVARAVLEDMLALAADGLAEPLLAPATTAHAYAEARISKRRDRVDADEAAATCWDPSHLGWAMDGDSAATLLLLGDRLPYDALTADPARSADLGPDGVAEDHRLAGLAMRMWAPLLTHLGSAG